MKRKRRRFGAKKVEKIQEELCALGVLEEFKNYRISRKYMSKFLSAYSDSHGKYGYIQQAIIFPLFGMVKEKNDSVSEGEFFRIVNRYFPIIRCMLEHEGIFKAIKRCSQNSGKKRI